MDIFGGEQNDTLDYLEFLERFSRKINHKSINEDIVCCPEPICFYENSFKKVTEKKEAEAILKELKKDKESREEKYRKVPEFQRICVCDTDDSWEWSRSTQESVFLRPGKNKGTDQMADAITLGDENVHGVIVGRTGSGKSVFINQLLLTMLHEYAPWELDLYLIDLKKVELGKYMSSGLYTPHVCECAITEEIRYVVSMLEHIYKCMQVRLSFFTKLGVKKLSEFRKAYKLVLPRMVVVVDEFQQIYMEATGKEEGRIRFLINSIIRLGRATGVHLLFASQDMGNVLNNSEMANFKLRFALPCDKEVSMSVLGSTVAGETKLGYGIVYVNERGGKSDAGETYGGNKAYTVPFIDDQKSQEGQKDTFIAILEKMKLKSERSGYKKHQSFYDEDAQEEIKVLKNILSREEVKEKRGQEISEKPNCYDIITLGRGVVHSDKKNNIGTFYIERGKNKNILAICNKITDLAYVQQLLALNFKYAPYQQEMEHHYFSFCPYIKYDITEDLGEERVKKYTREDDLDKIKNEFEKRKASGGKEYPRWTIWISGVDYMEKGTGYSTSCFDSEMLEIMENGLMYNMLFLLFSTSADTEYVTAEIKKVCDYLFAKDVQDFTYEKLKMNESLRSKNEIVIDFKIKSFNEERSFKKYKTEFRDVDKAPELDFDTLLKDENNTEMRKMECEETKESGE